MTALELLGIGALWGWVAHWLCVNPLKAAGVWHWLKLKATWIMDKIRKD